MNTTHRKPLPGTDLDYFDARAAINAIRPGAWDDLPYTSRIHAENLVRRCDPAILRECLEQIIECRRDRDFPTDSLSPSNAILLDSAAGEYLAKMGLPEEDFNSYATHRGDHLTAQRATFANPTLVNEMAVVDGKIRKGSLARVVPDGKVMRMWKAIEIYMERKQPLIIIAGADYGQGSSRDWAAKGVRLAGVEAIVAEGFERIHRTNLVGMGVMPLEFKPGVNRKTLGLDGTETYDVIGARKPRADLTLVVHRSNGERIDVPVTCRLDTAEEASIYEAGGVLQRFARDFLESSAAA